MPYNGRYYVNSTPKYKILLTYKSKPGKSNKAYKAKIVSVTTFSMAEYYEIFDEGGEPFTDRDKAQKRLDQINSNLSRIVGRREDFIKRSRKELND